MKIVLVVDQFDHSNNGTTITARRFAEQLRRRGHTVTVLAAGAPEPDKICVPTHTIPLFQSLVDAQGMCFAQPVDEAYYQAFRGADIVHFYMPFRFCRRGESIARQMGIPTIAAFHVQPENITSSIGLGRQTWVNHRIYQWFYHIFYNRFRSIHCPSQFIADQLAQQGYDARCYVISNGVDRDFRPPETPVERTDGTFRILMIGRLSGEKRQDLILQAAGLSRHRDKIQLIFAGKGPLEDKYRAMGQSLPRQPVFGFYTKEELVRLIHSCDLYVHASDAEIEGISCMEAFACGLVPVISNSPLSATHQFALDPRCTFQAGDARSLARQMDYWLEHPEERAQMGQRYARYGDTMRVDRCVAQAEQMYQETIDQWKVLGYRRPEESRLRRLTHPDPDRMVRTFGSGWSGWPWLKAAFTNLLSPLLWLLDGLGWGFTVEGREHLEGISGGAVTVMNHIHPMDCTMVRLATCPRRMNFISMQDNLKLPFAGWLLRACGAVPLPQQSNDLLHLEKQLEQALARGEWVHYYAEGLLVRYHDGVRPFHRGAFLTAVRSGCPVVPMRLVSTEPRGLSRLWRPNRPTLRLIIGAPLYPNTALSRPQAIRDLMERTHRAVEALGPRQEIRPADPALTSNT